MTLSSTDTTNKVLFIDFNGVISYKPFWFSLAEPSHPLHEFYEKINQYLFKENIDVVKTWMVGGHTSEDVHNFICQGLNAHMNADALWEIFVDDCKNLDLSQNIAAELTQLKGKYKIVLMTDNMDSFDRFTLAANQDYFSVFDDVCNSYNEKRSKRETGSLSFHKFINQFNSTGGESILVDDSEKNCAAFTNEVQGRAHQVKTEEDVLGVLTRLKLDV